MIILAKGLLSRPQAPFHPGAAFYAVVAGVLAADIVLGGSRLLREYRASPERESRPATPDRQDGYRRLPPPTRSLIGDIRPR